MPRKQVTALEREGVYKQKIRRPVNKTLLEVDGE